MHHLSDIGICLAVIFLIYAFVCSSEEAGGAEGFLLLQTKLCKKKKKSLEMNKSIWNNKAAAKLKLWVKRCWDTAAQRLPKELFSSLIKCNTLSSDSVGAVAG